MNRYERYKDSGIPWLGEIPKHWNICHLKDEVTFNDEVLGDKTDADYEILYVDISSVSLIEGIVQKEPMSFEDSPSRARRIVKNGDVIISTVRTYLKAITQIQDAEDNLIVSTGFAVLRPKENLFPRFLGYWVQSENIIGAIVSNSVGVSYPAINATDLVRLPIVKLPLKEQTAIAHYLDTKLREIDALIDKQQTLLEKLAEQRTAVITHAVTKGLNPAAPMKNSGVEWLGDVPAHWDVSPFKLVMNSIIDYRGKTPEKTNSGVFLITARNIKNGIIDYTLSQEFIDEDNYEEVMRRGLPKLGQVLMTTEAPLGEVAQIDRTDVALAQRVLKFDGKKNKLDNRFLKYFILSKAFQASLYKFATGSTALGIKSERLSYLKSLLPPITEQTAIADYLDQETAKIDRLCETVNQTIGRLKEYRTALITQAVTGKIKVTDE